MPPPIPLQNQHYQQWLPMNMPLPSYPVGNNPRNFEDAVSVNRADVAKAFIEGQVSQQVAHSLIEDPKILMHEGQTGLHSGERERQRGGGFSRGAKDKEQRTDRKKR